MGRATNSYKILWQHLTGIMYLRDRSPRVRRS